MLLFGACACRAVLALPPPAVMPGRLDARLRPYLVASALVAVATAIFWLMLEAASMGDGWAAAVDPPTVGAVLGETSFGAVWRWRLALAALLPAAVIRGRCAPSLRLGLAGLFLGSLGLTGHAVIGEGIAGVLHRSAQVTHLLAAGAWLGGLVPLAMLVADVGLPATDLALEPALRRFSGLGYTAVGLVLATGAINTSFMLTSRLQVLGTTYGRALLVKLALVAVMLGLALLNRLVLVPQMARSTAAALARLRRSLTIELALGAAILAVVSVLGMLPPAAFAAG